MAFSFEDYEVDVARRELRRAGRPVALEPQVFDVLVYLIENRARVVSKDDLIRDVWGGRIVSESTLTSRIAAARKAVGDTGSDQRLIRTVQRKGLRFIGEPREAASSATSASVTSRPALVLPDLPSIAVLPFADMSGGPDGEYFADGITEDIITALAKWRWFFVIARNSSFTYKGRHADVRAVAQELGVRYVLEGSVRRAGDRLRITAQLVDASTGAHLWAERYDGVLGDVFELQDRLSASIVGAIEPQLKSAELARIRQKRPESLQAYDYYLQALPPFYRQTCADNDEACKLLAQAIAADPGYALAYAMSAYCRHSRRMQGWGSPAEEEREGMRLAERALALGGDDPAVLWIGGYMIATLGHDLGRGRLLIDRSLGINVNDAQAWALSGWNHANAGNGRAAIEHLERAVRLSPVDPMSHIFHAGIGAGYMVLGEFERMVEPALLSVRLGPTYSSNWRFLAVALVNAGCLDEARQAIRRLLELEPGLTVAKVQARRNGPVDQPHKIVFLDSLRRAGLPAR